MTADSGAEIVTGSTKTEFVVLIKMDLLNQVMLLGDSGVGKTCLLVRFRDGTFLSGNFISTVGIDFRVRKKRETRTCRSLFSTSWGLLVVIVVMLILLVVVVCKYPGVCT